MKNSTVEKIIRTSGQLQRLHQQNYKKSFITKEAAFEVIYGSKNAARKVISNY